MIDDEKGKVAILRLKEARKAVLGCGWSSECWILKEIETCIEMLQLEIEDWRGKDD